MNRITAFLIVAILFSVANARAQSASEKVITGAERMSVYLPFLKGKSVAVFANQTSMIGNTHLVDTLLKKDIKVIKIFGPEHGFRGTADAGEHVDNTLDKKTGIPVVSLYGDHKKPTAEDLKNVDVVIFDIQDVGVRFYTFISSLEYVIDACAENKKELIILDRPNPNGFYVDGPVLQNKFKGFLGMQNIPVVYGMTVGEYAQMLVNENLCETKIIYPVVNIDLTADKRAFLYSQMQGKRFSLTIIKCKNYDHNTKYTLPVNPSPNLRDMQAIYLYPSTCFFEGTVLSEGRGTDKPFQYIGHPAYSSSLFSFTPKPNEGAKSSKCVYQKCYGWDLSGSNEELLKNLSGKIRLKYLLNAYRLFPGKDSFFLKNNFFNKLAGNDLLMAQIKAGKTEQEIRKSWARGIEKFKAIRKKYLLYKDFE